MSAIFRNKRDIILLIVTALFLFFTALFYREDLLNQRVTIVQHFISDFSYNANYTLLNILFGILLSVSLIVSFYIVTGIYRIKIAERFLGTSLIALILFVEPGFIYFSPIHIVAIGLLWANFCFLINQRFTAFFLISIASLFYPPVIWLAISLLFILFVESDELIRKFLKSIVGIILPFIFIISYKFVRYNEVRESVDVFFQKAIDINPLYISPKLSSLFFIFILVFILVKSIYITSKSVETKGRQNAYVFNNQLVFLLLSALFFIVFYKEGQEPLFILLASPVSIFLSRYFCLTKGKTFANVDFILSIASIIIYRLGLIIN